MEKLSTAVLRAPNGDMLAFFDWQDGPIKENGVNGVQVEDVIQVAIDRIKELNQAPYNCRENSLAITDLESAQNWLYRRTREREARGVEGTHTP